MLYVYDVRLLFTVQYTYQLLSTQMHTLNTKCVGKHTHNTVNHSYVEVFPHMRSSNAPIFKDQSVVVMQL